MIEDCYLDFLLVNSASMVFGFAPSRTTISAQHAPHSETNGTAATQHRAFAMPRPMLQSLATKNAAAPGIDRRRSIPVNFVLVIRNPRLKSQIYEYVPRIQIRTIEYNLGTA